MTDSECVMTWNCSLSWLQQRRKCNYHSRSMIQVVNDKSGVDASSIAGTGKRTRFPSDNDGGVSTQHHVDELRKSACFARIGRPAYSLDRLVPKHKSLNSLFGINSWTLTIIHWVIEMSMTVRQAGHKSSSPRQRPQIYTESSSSSSSSAMPSASSSEGMRSSSLSNWSSPWRPNPRIKMNQ